MKNDLLACRHIGISEKDEEKMLRKIGVGSLVDRQNHPCKHSPERTVGIARAYD